VRYIISKIINELDIAMVKSQGKAQGTHTKYFIGRGGRECWSWDYI